jgi:hypothetical protein
MRMQLGSPDKDAAPAGAVLERAAFQEMNIDGHIRDAARVPSEMWSASNGRVDRYFERVL